VPDKVTVANASVAGKAVGSETHGASIESSRLVSPARECPQMLMYLRFSEREGASHG
jgi:hypothetical protein